MRIIVGYGNELRGEDAFGVDVIKKLTTKHLADTKLLSAFQLTPEIVLELLDAKEIIFVDASYSLENHYALATSLENKCNSNLSHHITPQSIIAMLNMLYNSFPNYSIYSMLTYNFEMIEDTKEYEKALQKIVEALTNERN